MNLEQTFRSLKQLNLSHNLINFESEGTSCLFALVNLEQLDLSYNHISSLKHSGIEQLTRLVSVDLSHNNISNVSHFMYLAPLHHLKSLAVKGNAFVTTFGELNLRLVCTNMFSGLQLLDGHPLNKQEPVIQATGGGQSS